MGDHELESVSEAALARPDDGAIDWQAAFPRLDEKDIDQARPLDVMREDAVVGPYLKDVVAVPARKQVYSASAGLAFLLVAAFVAWFGGWELFQRYQPVEPDAPPTPAGFQLSVPEPYRADISAVNTLLAEERYASAYDSLKNLRETLAGDSARDTLSMREWVNMQLLILALRMSPPPYGDAAAWYGELEGWARERGAAHPPFQAMAAYTVLVENNGDVTDRALLMKLLEAMRNDYGQELDRAKPLLRIEAEAHMAALPLWRQTEPDFSNHWRRINHAVDAFGRAAGEAREEYILLDKKRWETMKRCFYLPVWNSGKTVKIGNVEFTWEYMNQRIDDLDRELKTIRARTGK